MRKLALFLIVLVGSLAAVSPAAAQESPLTPDLIADGVTIGGVAVGGMNIEQARAAIHTAFDVPLRFTFKKRAWKATPSQLGASPRSEAALAQARGAAPGTAIELITKIQGKKVRQYSGYLERVFNRPVKNTRVRVIKSKPRYSKPRAGVIVNRGAMTRTVLSALKGHDRDPLELAATLVEPTVTPDSFGPVVVIQRETKKLALYNGRKLVRKFGVATGLAQYPTPIGSFSIVNKLRDPTWTPPDSDWARGAQPIGPGPGNPLGTRWMGISSPLIGIHGTPDAASIGYSASHGCVRMHVSEAEWLFENVDVCTPIFITKQ
ncbi:MAG: L,D-transpeptidase [Gaiellaceae bacterium]